MLIHIFLHKELQNPNNKHYRNASIYLWCVMVLLLFLIPYCIYFAIYHPEDLVKNYTNVICVGLFALSMLLLKFSPNFKLLIIYTAILAYIPIMISSYNTGGIYSADLAWMFGCMITQGLIMDYRWGIASSIIVCSYLSFLYFSEYQLAINKNIFKQYIVKYGSTHYYFTWVFVVLLIAAIIGTFARVLFNANLKIEQLSNSKIDELEIRVKQKTDELSELRNRLARDFHDEMGNKLASINILSQSVALTMDNTAENQQTIKLLETISLRSKELFDGTKDFIWAIDFKSDYLFELYIYLREFGERFFNELEINFVSTSNFTNELLLLLPATSSRQLVLICKEIMTNAAKHSNCSQVDFSINFSDNMALISIQDNGLGFDVDAVNKRGLANMQKRLESINAKMEVLSNNEGTSIKIEIKTIKS